MRQRLEETLAKQRLESEEDSKWLIQEEQNMARFVSREISRGEGMFCLQMPKSPVVEIAMSKSFSDVATSPVLQAPPSESPKKKPEEEEVERNRGIPDGLEVERSEDKLYAAVLAVVRTITVLSKRSVPDDESQEFVDLVKVRRRSCLRSLRASPALRVSGGRW